MGLTSYFHVFLYKKWSKIQPSWPISTELSKKWAEKSKIPGVFNGILYAAVKTIEIRMMMLKIYHWRISIDSRC